MNTQDIVADYYLRPDHEVRYCATAHYAETLLTHSVYILNCRDAHEAIRKAEEYFKMVASQSVICKTIITVEILPRNAGRWSNVPPEIVRHYHSFHNNPHTS